MTKRTGHIESGENTFVVRGDGIKGLNTFSDDNTGSVSVYVTQERAEEIAKAALDEALQRLIDSNIVTATDSAISWREGHLEHVARMYVADPVLAWRDYADDLTVALAADGSAFAAAVEKARGE